MVSLCAIYKKKSTYVEHQELHLVAAPPRTMRLRHNATNIQQNKATAYRELCKICLRTGAELGQNGEYPSCNIQLQLLHTLQAEPADIFYLHMQSHNTAFIIDQSIFF
jgi:hypothetical protein